jgi:hypothetical protein
MPKINLTRQNIYGDPLDGERHALRLFRDELREWPERYQAAKYTIPLIDKRLQDIEVERKRLALPESDPVRYAERERDYDLEIEAQLKAQRDLGNGDGISA